MSCAGRLATGVRQLEASSVVTALPASPADGQEVFYVADAVNLADNVVGTTELAGDASTVNYRADTVDRNTSTAGVELVWVSTAHGVTRAAGAELAPR